MQPGEKRKSPRRSISYPALIDRGTDQAPIECMFCDASQNGAQLTVADPNSVPDEFILALSSDGAARRRCRVVWRTENQIGVEYLKDLKTGARSTRHPPMRFDAPEQAAAPDETAERVDIDALPQR